MSMLKYIFKRFISLIPVLFGAITLTFILSRMMPGDPVLATLPQLWTEEDYNRQLHNLGLDRPIIEQYFRYLGDLFTGNWGVSVVINQGLKQE